MNSEVYKSLLHAWIQPNAPKIIGRFFASQIDNDTQDTSKVAKDFFKANAECSATDNSITWYESN